MAGPGLSPSPRAPSPGTGLSPPADSPPLNYSHSPSRGQRRRANGLDVVAFRDYSPRAFAEVPFQASPSPSHKKPRPYRHPHTRIQGQSSHTPSHKRPLTSPYLSYHVGH
jgi:hypothetical protein